MRQSNKKQKHIQIFKTPLPAPVFFEMGSFGLLERVNMMIPQMTRGCNSLVAVLKTKEGKNVQD